ncbi:MAG: DUF6288 domain-containing protein, partial [Phycisphaeraceae bacterium]|nr:DUF6288 domain-containing protein [Phycisphaeraceae bacterium]
MNRFLNALLALLMFGLMAPMASAADVRLGRFFSDGMVLQRNQSVLVRGFADAGAEVKVAFAGQTQTATAGESGEWSVTLDPMDASAEGRRLEVAAGGKKVALKDVVVGDVFLVARQTSIDVAMGEEAASKLAADGPEWRAVRIKTMAAEKPQADLAEGSVTGWSVVDEELAAKLSEATYHFGADLAARVDVPVGVVDLDMGPWFPISWMSREALMETEKFYGRTQVPGIVKRMEERQAIFREKGQVDWKGAPRSKPLNYPIYPAAGYNAVLHPLRGTALKGVVMQLGGNYPYTKYAELREQGRHVDREALNEAYVDTYDIRKTGFRIDPVTTPRIPGQWRAVFGNDDLPIGLVVPPSSALRTLARRAREMRELQRIMAAGDDQIQVILPGMEARPFSTQPQDELTIGRRALHWALGAVYGDDKIITSGPLMERVEVSHNTATVHFKPGTAEGLTAAEKPLAGFEVAGVDGEWFPAEAEIDGDVVRLTSRQVGRVAYVRYNWAEKPEANLLNSAGMPAVPFRTQEAPYAWFHRHAEDDLPEEYSTPANQWRGGDVTLVNGQVKTFGYDNFTGWLGPVGVRVGPFGPNMAVRAVALDSPAEGKLQVGDVIYSANGKMLGNDAEQVMSAAITESETAERGGKLVLG